MSELFYLAIAILGPMISLIIIPNARYVPDFIANYSPPTVRDWCGNPEVGGFCQLWIAVKARPQHPFPNELGKVSRPKKSLHFLS